MADEQLLVRWVQDKNGKRFFPRTHIDAVKNDEGVPLSTLLLNSASNGNRVIDGGSARTLGLDLAARRIDCGKSNDR